MLAMVSTLLTFHDEKPKTESEAQDLNIWLMSFTFPTSHPDMPKSCILASSQNMPDMFVTLEVSHSDISRLVRFVPEP